MRQSPGAFQGSNKLPEGASALIALLTSSSQFDRVGVKKLEKDKEIEKYWPSST